MKCLNCIENGNPGSETTKKMIRKNGKLEKLRSASYVVWICCSNQLNKTCTIKLNPPDCPFSPEVGHWSDDC